MKKPGFAFRAGDSVGEVESVKTTSDVYCACAGEVVETNSALAEDPSLLNSDPYGAGWLVKLAIKDAAGLDGLMDAAAYDAKYGT